jgi:hypothetical protein
LICRKHRRPAVKPDGSIARLVGYIMAAARPQPGARGTG